ncbi:MAG: sulfite exporter TauE/SafE family protein [Gammaproteobacteria bacterium]|nr:sulfite exporter TauE/SafE family protein [Gammaproteobacteria bacterium]
MSAVMIDLSWLQILLAILVIFVAYIIKGLSGFGSGLVAVPLLAFILPLVVIVPILGLLSYGGTVMQSISLRKQVVWPDLLPLIPFSLLGIVLALWLLVNLDAYILTLCLGGFVVLYALYSLIPTRVTACGRSWAMPAGALGGMIGALFGTGGPFYVIYLKLRQLDKSQFRATIAMIFLVDGGFRIIGYAVTGMYTSQVLILILLLTPVLLLGMYVGNHIHLNIKQHQFNRIISVLLLCSGMMLIYKSI